MALEINIESLSFSLRSLITITTSALRSKFCLTVDNNDSRKYYMQIYPIINGVRKGILKSKSSWVEGKEVKIIDITKRELINDYSIGNNQKTIDFRIYFYKNRNKNLIEHFDTSSGYKIDNRSISYSSNPTLTLTNDAGVNVGNHIIFPSTELSDNLELRVQFSMTNSLDTTSNNVYEHYIKITNNTIPSNLSYSNIISHGNHNYNFNFIDPKTIVPEKKYLIGTYFYINEIYSVLVGANKSTTKTSVTKKLIYAYGHIYNFNSTTLKWNSGATDFKHWQTDNSKTLLLTLNAVADNKFKVNGLLNYTVLPWPKIIYKVKVFSKEITPLNSIFDSHGYSDYNKGQSNLANLWISNYHTNYDFIKTYTNTVYQSALSSEVVTIDFSNASFANFKNNQNLYIYIITLDELGYYQCVYLNKGLDSTGDFNYTYGY